MYELTGKLAYTGRAMIWPVPLGDGKWAVTVAALPKPGSGGYFGGPDSGETLPGEFNSEEEALTAGEEYAVVHRVGI